VRPRRARRRRDLFSNALGQWLPFLTTSFFCPQLFCQSLLRLCSLLSAITEKSLVGFSVSRRIRGQTRCPVYRSRTFNVQRSTLNFQRGDRKGACWAEYGDRHDMYWCGTSLTLRSPPLDSRPELWHLTGKYGDRHGIWAAGALTRTCPGTCRPEEVGLGSVALLQGETQQSRRL